MNALEMSDRQCPGCPEGTLGRIKGDDGYWYCPEHVEPVRWHDSGDDPYHVEW